MVTSVFREIGNFHKAGDNRPSRTLFYEDGQVMYNLQEFR
jgi:hypothetical protein